MSTTKKRKEVIKMNKEKMLSQRATYINTVIEASPSLPGKRQYVVAVLVAHYNNRKTGEFEFTFTDLEARDPWGKSIPTYKLSAILDDHSLLNTLIDLYSDGKVYPVSNYIDFEDAMNKKCRGGHEIESSGVVFLHINEMQFNAISSISSLIEIEGMAKEVV